MIYDMATTGDQLARTQISLALPARTIELLDRQAAVLGLSRPRYIARLLVDQQQRLDIAHDISILRETVPDDDSRALVDWASEHPIDRDGL